MKVKAALTPQPLTKYYNIYLRAGEPHIGSGHETRATADGSANPGRIGCLKITTTAELS